MHDVCFCGHQGDLEARKPVRAVDGSWTLCCPHCNRLDDLSWMPARSRAALWQRVWSRQLRGHVVERAELAGVK